MRERELLDMRHGGGTQEPKDWFKAVDHREKPMHKTESVVTQFH